MSQLLISLFGLVQFFTSNQYVSLTPVPSMNPRRMLQCELAPSSRNLPFLGNFLTFENVFFRWFPSIQIDVKHMLSRMWYRE